MADPPQPSLKWSSQFTVTSTRSHTLSGDKILLPASALEALLSASSSLAAERARQDLPTYDPYNSSTYSAYRRAESEYQDQKQQLPYPLTFRLVNPENGRFVYAGIREFSSDEGQAVLSPFLRESLGLKDEVPKDQDDMEVTGVNGGKEETGIIGHDNATGPVVTIHVRELPKGTFVKLRPLEAGYDPEDWKALLEQHLRQSYTTMTNGEVLVVPGSRTIGGQKEQFRFLVDGFKPESDGICVVDTDLEVDIEALNEDQARETLKRIAEKMAKAPGSAQGSSTGGELDLFRPRQGQVLPGEYVDFELSSWSKTQPLEIELEAEDIDELDLLVSPFSNTQRARPRLSEHVFADLHGRPTKRIRLEPTNVELEHAEALYVSVHAFSSAELGSLAADKSAPPSTHSSTFAIRVRHPDSMRSIEKPDTTDEHLPPNEDDVRCKNCSQWVPKRTLILHENFCLRNNILCSKGCGQVFQRQSEAFAQHWHCPFDSVYGNTEPGHTKHDSLCHPSEILHCSECATAETFSSIASLARHRTTTCPAKLILCRFCHLVVPQEGDPDVPNAEALLSGMTPHELADGARTTECHLCNKIVRLRDMETHLKSHDMDRLSRPMPLPCRNDNCGRTLDVCSKTGDTRAGSRMGQGPGNDIGLCSTCFGPLYVSMYDPENKALRRRIERRYLQQLVTGCGKSWCRNEFCKTARGSLGLSTNVTTKDAIPMIKPYLEGLSQKPASTALHFCVDETSQKRRGLAALLAAELRSSPADDNYRFEWCLGALEAENGDLDAAKHWLKNWAPTETEEAR